MRNITFIALFVGIILSSCDFSDDESARVIEDFNFGWKFHLGDQKGAEDPGFNDAGWKDVRLPHDWSVEHSFTQEDAAGATAFLPGGIGWYRKSFLMPESAKTKLTSIEFDGVYSNSEVWINGHFMGKRPYGYIPFSYDLTPYLHVGEKENIIAVRADRSAYVDCRWYPGSGIYRNVKLVTVNKVHIPQWGTFVRTPLVTKEKAEIEAVTEIRNSDEIDLVGVLKTSISFKGEEVLFKETSFKVGAGEITSVIQAFDSAQPQLWDTENPNLYIAKSDVYVDDKQIDSYTTRFGIRNIRFDADEGFFLNGVNTLLKGVCLHHDGGLVGAAVPKGVWKRRLETLKAGGCNAIRTAHNPPSGEFLDLCDELGFLVEDEAFDEWNNPKDKRNNYNQKKAEEVTRGYTEHFSAWSERDLKAMVMRDRNHPSIIMWSIGNEIEWTYPRYGASTGYWGANKVGDVNYYDDEPRLSIDQIKANFEAQPIKGYELVPTARNLSKWIKEIDTSRPVTANLVIPSVSNFSGYADALDVVGLSYRQAVYDYCKRNYPDKVFLGTENWARYHEWKPVVEKKFISGIFLWTGINYMGESGHWPSKGSGSGLLDFAGFEKPSYHMFKTLWNEEPHIYLTTQLMDKSPYKVNKEGQVVEKYEGWSSHQHWGWQNVNEHWNYSEGDMIAVEVYTNVPEVILYLNKEKLGSKKLRDAEDKILKWIVPFKEGLLKAVGVGGEEIARYKIKTSGEASMIKLSVDKTRLKADAYDVTHVVAQVCDVEGIPVKNKEFDITFNIDGDMRLLGVDNGSTSNVQDIQTNHIRTSKGRCLMILQSTFKEGEVKVSATSGKMQSNSVHLELIN